MIKQHYKFKYIKNDTHSTTLALKLVKDIRVAVVCAVPVIVTGAITATAQLEFGPHITITPKNTTEYILHIFNS